MHIFASVLLLAAITAVLQGALADPINPDISAKLNETEIKVQLVEAEEKLSENIGTSTTATKINRESIVKIGSKYFYVEDRFKLNFYSALIYCRRLGAYLAVIQNEEDLSEISKKLNEHQNYWLDISRLANVQEEKYSSLSTGKVVTFLKWAQGEPTDYNQTEACVSLLNGTMNTKSCGDNHYYFICEDIE